MKTLLLLMIASIPLTVMYVVLGICIIMVLREFYLWYFNIKVIVKELKEINVNLKKFLEK